MGNNPYYSTSGVPACVDSENNHNERTHSKYTVNQTPKPGAVILSRSVLLLLMAGVTLLLVAAVLATYFLVPRCSGNGELDGIEPERSPLTYFRLPKTIRPISYRISIMPFLEEGNFTTYGEVEITFKCIEDTDRIALNINDIQIQEDSVTVKELNPELTEEIKVNKHEYDENSQRYTAMLSQYVLAGKMYNLTIKYTGHLNDLLQGFYRISYVDSKSGTQKWMAATQFSPTDARRAFPCFDEPAMKATFTISLARPKKMLSRSNMPLKESTSIPDMPEWIWDHYHETPVMSTYLVAMVVSELQPFKYNTSTPNSKAVEFAVWSRKEALEQTRYAGSIGPRILEYLEKYFEIPYPLPKLDMFALPDFGYNAMENWGLVTFRESSLLYDENVSTTSSKKMIANVISHELGHQWFGNLVTPGWWDDLWLKEGFATYLQYFGVEHVHPSWNFLDEIVLSEIQTSLELDSLLSSHPIHIPVHRTHDIRQIFDKISYSKGASIIRMANHIIGEKSFKAGLINYLKTHEYSNTYHDDLWASLDAHAHSDGTLPNNMSLKKIMDSWILQTGYPVLNVTRDYTNNSVTITQKRFLLSGKPTKSQLWWVPISYTTKSQNDFNSTKPKVWMESTEEITIKNISNSRDWIYINVKEVGYYRVNYDMNNWKMLLDNIMQFPYVCRAQLIDDAMDLARANMLHYMVPFNFLIELFKDVGQQHISLSAAFNGLDFLNNMLATTSTYGKFKDFLSVIIHQLYEYVGFTEKPVDSYDLQMKRSAVLKWACLLETSECIIQARQIFRNWMIHGQQYKIAPNLKSVVYCTSIREGGEAEWTFAYEQYKTTNLATEKRVLLEALGCSSEPWILSRYLEYTLSNSSGIRKQDGSVVFESVSQNVVGHLLAFDFLRTNWHKINAYYGMAFSTISKMVSTLPIYMNTQFQLSQLEDFKKDNIKSLGTSEQALDRAIEEVHANVMWMTNSYKQVDEWLDLTKKRYRLK